MKKRYLLVIICLLSFSLLFGKNNNYKLGRLNKGQLFHKGLKRDFIFYLPSKLNKEDKPVPLIFLLHGGGGTAEGMIKLTKNRFNEEAENRNFVLVYPQGYKNHWNDNRGESALYSAHKMNIDDVGFISALIEKISSEFAIDKNKIFVTGISNGGFMSYRLACELSDRISAIAVVTANLSENLKRSCEPQKPVSVMVINGTDDPLVPFVGGDVTGPFGGKKLGKVISSADTVKFWVEKNECQKEFQIEKLSDNFEDGTTVEKEIYKNCNNGKKVVFYKIKGGGHTWPDGLQYMPQWVIGKTSREINAVDVICDFFML